MKLEQARSAADLTDLRWAAGLTLLFFLVVGVGIAHHEMWRDELQAWMLARDSTSLPEMFWNLRYEGHPAAWHVLLFLLSRLTRNAVAMQLLHLLIATCAVYLIAGFSPLPRYQKALLAFGYFFAYEYAVISRGYVLGVLMVFAFCATFPQRHRHCLPLAILLLVLANTSAYGLILALALGATLLFEWIIDADLRQSLAEHRGQVALSVALFAAGVIAAIIQILPPADFPFTGEPGASPQGWSNWLAAQSAATLWNAYAPIPDLTNPHPWGMNLIVLHGRLQRMLSLFLSLILGLGAVLLFLYRPVVLFLYVLGTGGLLLFTYLIHFGALRHHGHLFVLFVACLWLARIPSRTWEIPFPLRRMIAHTQGRHAFVAVVLIAQLAAAVLTYVSDLRHPFSAARAAAAFIRNQRLDRLPLAGSIAHLVSPVAGYLDKKIYYLEMQDSGSFVLWGKPIRKIGKNSTPGIEGLRTLLVAEGPEVILILTFPFSKQVDGLIVEELAHFPTGIEPFESYYIYRVRDASRSEKEGIGGRLCRSPSSPLRTTPCWPEADSR